VHSGRVRARATSIARVRGRPRVRARLRGRVIAICRYA
jgi:hypothetical protein